MLSKETLMIGIIFCGMALCYYYGYDDTKKLCKRLRCKYREEDGYK